MPIIEATSKTPGDGLTVQPTSSTFSLRLEYAPDAAGDLPIRDQDLLPNWLREFAVSGKTTLEQLSEIILGILDWDSLHLYEFRIDNRVYAHLVLLSEDDLFVDAQNPCVSCDIPIRLLGLSVSDTFAYVFDYGDCHTFRLTVLDIRSTPDMQSTPMLISHKGRNIIQYRGAVRKADALAFENQPPTITPPKPTRDRWRSIVLDKEFQSYLPDENRALEILKVLSGDPGLERDKRSKNLAVGDEPALAGIDLTNALLSIAIGVPNAALCRRFLISPRRAVVLRETMFRRFPKLFAWLSDYRRKVVSDGFASFDDRRKYWEGLGSSDMAKRSKAVQSAVRWVIGM
jgi:hypothetical protein